MLHGICIGSKACAISKGVGLNPIFRSSRNRADQEVAGKQQRVGCGNLGARRPDNGNQRRVGVDYQKDVSTWLRG